MVFDSDRDLRNSEAENRTSDVAEHAFRHGPPTAQACGNELDAHRDEVDVLIANRVDDDVVHVAVRDARLVRHVSEYPVDDDREIAGEERVAWIWNEALDPESRKRRERRGGAHISIVGRSVRNVEHVHRRAELRGPTRYLTKDRKRVGRKVERAEDPTRWKLVEWTRGMTIGMDPLGHGQDGNQRVPNRLLGEAPDDPATEIAAASRRLDDESTVRLFREVGDGGWSETLDSTLDDIELRAEVSRDRAGVGPRMLRFRGRVGR